MSNATKVRVCVRCRPLQSKEVLTQKFKKAVVLDNRKVVAGDKKEFVFDTVFGENSNQEDIYGTCVENLIDGCFSGYNATIFAYGQTGSGKTHTMFGPSAMDDVTDEGIIPRSLRHIFRLIETDFHRKVVNLRVSFLELYNEEIRDLLHADVPSRVTVAILMNNMTRAREEVVSSMEDVFRFIEAGSMVRTTAETWMNESSSRSHAIFTVSLEIFDYVPRENIDDPPTETATSYIHSKLHLVDLAGSERAKRTGAVGVRLKESVGINQGLLSLGKVIRALTTPVSKQSNFALPHIPYRESKLTRFLQDSLGGNSNTLMLACISPSDADLQETISTLQYASRARAVQNKVTANITTAPVLVEDGIIEALRMQLHKLQTELQERDARDASMLRRSLTSPRASRQGFFADTVRHLPKQLTRSLEDAIRDAENIVDNLLKSHPEVAQLKNILLRMRGALDHISSEAHSSSADATVHMDEIASLKLELAECKEDLKRDEEIFAEKVMELKKSRKNVRRLEAENSELMQQIADLHSKMDVLQECVANTEESKESKIDDLDISQVVAAKEPDVSQLMDDIEQIARDKEQLIEEKKRAEAKCEEASRLAEEHQERYEKNRMNYEKQLKSLEINIRMKQELINALTHKQQEIISQADVFQQRIMELEKDKLSLKTALDTQIEQMSTIQRHNKEDAVLREEYEEKLKKAEEEISAAKRTLKFQQEQYKSVKAQIAEASSPAINTPSDLDAMKKEYRALKRRLEEEENRQKKEIDALKTKIDKYRDESVASQKQIKRLEQINVDLQRTASTGGYRAKFVSRSRSTGTNNDAAVINRAIKQIIDLKISIAESAKLNEHIDALTREKNDLLLERENIVTKDNESKAVLQKQFHEISARVHALNKEIKSLHSRRNEWTDEEQALCIEKERTLRQLQEHKAELVIRAEESAFDPEDEAKLEELDALDTELSVAVKHLNNLSAGDGGIEKRMERLESELEHHMKVSDADVLQRAFCSVADAVAEDKLSQQKLQNEVNSLRAALEDKQVEHDKLVALMHHTRTDFTRKLEKQQQQYDMKISYLVNQLKLSEAKLNESVNILKSTDCNRPETSSTTADDVLQRRWQSEKERREQLERRNGELVREIRKLRDITRHTKSSGSAHI